MGCEDAWLREPLPPHAASLHASIAPAEHGIDTRLSLQKHTVPRLRTNSLKGVPWSFVRVFDRFQSGPQQDLVIHQA